MKKLINKLFEWLGYVPKKYKDLYEETRYNWGCHNKSVFSRKNKFTFGRRYEKDLSYNEYGYVVLQKCDDTDKYWAVKFFPENGDKSYARLCAEELCEKLNEKY